MTVEWHNADKETTLAHSANIELGSKKASLPQHALTHSDYQYFSSEEDVPASSMVFSAENLNHTTFKGVGVNAAITDALFSKMKTKLAKNTLNLVYMRIANKYETKQGIFPVTRINDMQASGLVGLQLDLNASAVIVPVPNGIQEKGVFDRILERTENEIKTFRSDKEMVGLIPKSNDLNLIRSIVKEYVKSGVRHFATDFSGATIPRAQMRTIVRAIRDHLKISKTGDVPENKQYTLHVLNASVAVKSASPVTSITDLLTHVYGVDSTSGVIWGGGKLVKDNLRFYNVADYGAYRLGTIDKYPQVSVQKRMIEGDAKKVYGKLRMARISAYRDECKVITRRIANEEPAMGYAAHLSNKQKSQTHISEALMDIKEIKAG